MMTLWQLFRCMALCLGFAGSPLSVCDDCTEVCPPSVCAEICPPEACPPEICPPDCCPPACCKKQD